MAAASRFCCLLSGVPPDRALWATAAASSETAQSLVRYFNYAQYPMKLAQQLHGRGFIAAPARMAIGTAASKVARLRRAVAMLAAAVAMLAAAVATAPSLRYLRPSAASFSRYFLTISSCSCLGTTA